jgi:hypothetical protein
MNRLILVGNGFDLAHGFKTSYKDFIIWYLVQCFGHISYVPKTYQDELLQIEFNDFNSFVSFINAHKSSSFNFRLTKEDLTDFIVNCFEEQTIKSLLNIYDNDIYNSIVVSSDDNYAPNHYNNRPFRVTILSSFLESLIINCQDCNWVDIENEYFDQLKACQIRDKFDNEKVTQLNSEFAYLKRKLEEYLIIQQEQTNIKVIPELTSAIGSQFDISDFEPLMGYENARIELEYNKTIKTEIKHNIYILNFNYTDIVQKYQDELNRIPTDFSNIEINYIHGQLNTPDNSIIFGFGDEHDKQYLEFEEHRNNELYEHIKSYQYLRTPNYRKLLMFLNNSSYQVFVMGHACGLSDRTMFKEIFEHENCKSIRLFHYNGDFHNKAINVSKHFNNKGHMRKLMVNYKASDAFPQSIK